MSASHFIKAIKKQRIDNLRSCYEKCGFPPTHEQSSGKSIYHLAIECRNLDLLRALHLLTALDPDTFDRQGRTSPVACCLLHDFPEGLVFLKQIGANFNATNVEGWSALHLGAAAGMSAALCRLMIELGAWTGVPCSKGYAVHLAAETGNSELTKLLMDHEDWQSYDSKGKNVLHTAIIYKLPEVVQYAVAKGGQEAIGKADYFGRSALELSSGDPTLAGLFERGKKCMQIESECSTQSEVEPSKQRMVRSKSGRLLAVGAGVAVALAGALWSVGTNLLM